MALLINNRTKRVEFHMFSLFIINLPFKKTNFLDIFYKGVQSKDDRVDRFFI